METLALVVSILCKKDLLIVSILCNIYARKKPLRSSTPQYAHTTLSLLHMHFSTTASVSNAVSSCQVHSDREEIRFLSMFYQLLVTV